MKKIKLVLLFVAIASNDLFAQGRINYSMSELLNEFSIERYPNRAYGKNADGQSYHLFIAGKDGKVAYYFDKDSFCYKTLFVALNEERFNYFINFCDKEYIKINNKKWVAIDDKTCLETDVEIIEDKNDIFFKRLGKYAKFSSSDNLISQDIVSNNKTQLPSVLAMRSDYHKLGNYGEGVDTVHYDYVNNYDVDFLFTKDTIFIFDDNGVTINLTSIGYLEDFIIGQSKFILLYCENLSLGKEGENCRFLFGVDTVANKSTVVLTNLDKVAYFNISKIVSTDDNAINNLVATLPKFEYEVRNKF
jgi:hypothetical protein